MVDFEYNQAEPKLVCNIRGRMGTETNEPFLAKVTEKITESKSTLPNPADLKVSFDMRDVTYIASSFIRSCIVISRLVEAGSFDVVNASPVIKKTFKIAGLDELLQVK